MRCWFFFLAIAGLVSAGACRTADPAGLASDTAPPSNILRAELFPGATISDRIRAALAALPAAGGIVDASALSGVDTVTRTIEVGSASNVVELRLGSLTLVGRVLPLRLRGEARLVGNGRTRITQANAANLEAVLEGVQLRRCELTGFTLDGNRDNNQRPGSGIALFGAVGCRLHRLTVENTVGYLHPGIAFYGDGNRENTVEHNVVRDIGTLVNYADGIYVSGPGNKVLFNRIDRATDFAIVGEVCSGCLMHGNTITATPAGIGVGSGIAGASAGANIIEGNSITGGLTSHWGIITVYRTHGKPPVATVIRGNVVRDVELGSGVLVNGAKQVSIEGNILTNIAVNESSYGIYIRDSEGVSVTGGSIDRTGSFGIGIGNSSDVRVDGVSITDAARSGNGASGIGFDVLSKASTSISLTRLTIFDRASVPGEKRMPWCIDFGQGGRTEGVLMSDILFDDGTNAVGCRLGNVNLTGASRVIGDS